MAGSAPAAAGFSDRLLGALAALLAASCAPAAVPGGPSSADLSGTSWRVVQVNGRATPALGDYSMSFKSGQAGARFGCNHMGGRYRQSGDVVIVSDLAQTLMGCAEPANTFESDGARVLVQPMRITFGGSARLVLSNAAGSIALERAP